MDNQASFLYKYRAVQEENINWTRRIFTHNELYFPSKNQFNDPFDCKFDYSFSATEQQMKRYLNSLGRNHADWGRKQRQRWTSENLNKLKKHAPVFEEGLKAGSDQILAKIGICSLSSVPDDILMWSHYAQSHEGFCIKLVDDVTDKFIARAQKVSYSEDYPIVNPIIDDDLDRMKKSLLTKAKQWEYENEWRKIDYELGPGIKRFPPHLLVGVIFGCRMSEDHQRLIRDWCKNRQPSVSFYQARQASLTYALDIVEVP